MEAVSANSHVSGGRNGGDDDDDDDGNNQGQNPQEQTQPQASNKNRPKGRRKIEIKRIESERARLSTFSKRRSGIYKKANEIATLCDAQVGVVGITPAGRSFAYGSPSAEVIIQRFLQPNHQIPKRQGIDGVVDTIVETNRRARIEKLNSRHDELLELIEKEKELFNNLVQIIGPFENQTSANPDWLDIPNVSDIPEEQLEAAAEELEDIKRQVAVSRQMPPLPPPPPAQPLQAAAAAAANPCADLVVAATNDNGADEVMDEEELMLRFFGSYPSTPPGPF